MNKIEIATIKLKLGSKEIELTLAEAREVREELNRLLGNAIGADNSALREILDEMRKRKEIEYVPYPVAPIVIERPYWPRPYEIWCGDRTDNDPCFGLPVTVCSNLPATPYGNDVAFALPT